MKGDFNFISNTTDDQRLMQLTNGFGEEDTTTITNDKEQNRKIRKAEKEVEEVEKQVSAFETELESMNKQLELPEFASDSDFIMLYQKKQRELEHKMYEWEILCEDLENLKAQLND